MTVHPDSVVLCGVDATTGARSVIAAAKAWAKRSSEPLLLAHVVASMHDAEVPAFREDAGPDRVIAYGPAGRQLLGLADRHDAGLIVLGTRGLGRVGSVLRASVSRHVARRAHCPVMIVGPHADPEAPATGGRVVCRDHTDDAAELARRLGAELVVVGPDEPLDLSGAAAVVVGWRERDLVLRSPVPVIVRRT